MTKPNIQPSGHPTVLQTGILCSPPRLKADTDAKRVIDRILPTGAWRCAFFIAIAVGISAAGQLPTTPGLALGAATTFVASGYCLLNFWRCREAHCVISGTGWAALGRFETAEIALGHSLIHRNEGAVFVATLAIAIAFEAYWRTRHGTNALRATDSYQS
ncbi:MAG: hypothetical protein ACRDL8_00150 [Solirubrobacteraceae bacterium]